MRRDGPGRPDNEALLEAARRGDTASVARLFDRHRGLVVAVCTGVLGRSHLLPDAVQEVFLRLLLSIREIRRPDRLGAWLGTVARHTALDLRRAEGRTSAGRRTDAAPGPLERLVRDERRRAVLDAVMDLRPEYREAILMRYMHSRSYREIAAALDVPVSTVETRLHRARKTLAARIGDQIDEL
ncbi:MAG: RNA polymerase sigma factor [Planctomycetota bacterium]